MSGIFFRQGDELIEMTEQPYALEDHLQELLARHPNLLAGGQINRESPRRWLLVAREAGLPSEEDGSARWSVDHLFLDQDGTPTLVEVKRSSDTRIRREVVGQILDYAAHAVATWRAETMRELFETGCRSRGESPDEVVASFVGPDEGPEEFWERVHTNLQGGKLRLLVVSDEIPAELQRVVEYLNEQMTNTEVLAIEIRQFVGGGQQGLVPRVLGQTAVAQATKGRSSRSARKWHKESVLADLEVKTGQETAAIAQRIFDWAETNELRITYGRGTNDGSFTPGLDDETGYLFPFVVYTNGAVEVQFQWLARFPQEPFGAEEKRRELQARLNQIDGVTIPDDRLEKRPSFPLEALVAPPSLERFLAVVEWAFEEARAARRAGFARPV
jgi:hypothetical protein